MDKILKTASKISIGLIIALSIGYIVVLRMQNRNLKTNFDTVHNQLAQMDTLKQVNNSLYVKIAYLEKSIVDKKIPKTESVKIKTTVSAEQKPVAINETLNNSPSDSLIKININEIPFHFIGEYSLKNDRLLGLLTTDPFDLNITVTEDENGVWKTYAGTSMPNLTIRDIETHVTRFKQGEEKDKIMFMLGLGFGRSWNAEHFTNYNLGINTMLTYKKVGLGLLFTNTSFIVNVNKMFEL